MREVLVVLEEGAEEVEMLELLMELRKEGILVMVQQEVMAEVGGVAVAEVGRLAELKALTALAALVVLD